jgi:sulfur carrier protein ThiS
MPTVTVAFVGPIRRPWKEQSRALELAEGSDADDLLDAVGLSGSEKLRVSVLVNGERRSLSTRLTEGDRVELLLLVGGG